MTLREKRHLTVTNTLRRTIAQRDACMSNLVRYELRIRTLRKQAQRLERALAKPVTVKPAKPEPKPVSDVTDIPFSELPIADRLDDEPAIPDFLRRSKDAKRKDDAAAASIRQEQAERKATKSRARIAKLKAKAAGDLRRMPLTGKAALEAIRNS